MKIYLVANTAGTYNNMNKLKAQNRLYSFYEIINKVFYAHKDFQKYTQGRRKKQNDNK